MYYESIDDFFEVGEVSELAGVEEFGGVEVRDLAEEFVGVFGAIEVLEIEK